MGISIQDYLKKINSWLIFPGILSLFITCIFLALLTGYILHTQQEKAQSVVYKVSSQGSFLSNGSGSKRDSSDVRPFGSGKGKTYTFSWCQGATRISSKNKIYFENEDEAKKEGRVLSKLCKK